MATRRSVNGRQLNERWGVNAEQALYSKSGRWYHLLDQFPGALFDPNGYVLFQTVEEYLACPQLRIGKELNVRGTISAIANYVRVHEPAGQAVDIAEPHDIVRKTTTVSRVVRDTPLARRVKALHAYRCQLCASTVQLQGDRLYAEGHHLRPLGSPHNGPDVAANILCVCPNCHTRWIMELSLSTFTRFEGFPAMQSASNT
jgi:hypothetical protein